MDLPAFCPEIPVSDLPAALAYYRDRLGLAVDWSDRELGLAGVSRGATRAFLSSAAYRDPLGNRPPVVLWLNLANRAEIDALHAEWQRRVLPSTRPPRRSPTSSMNSSRAIRMETASGYSTTLPGKNAQREAGRADALPRVRRLPISVPW